MVKPYTYIHTRTSSELRKRRQECRNRKDCLVKSLANFYIKHLWVKNPSISSDPLTENLHYWLENFLGKLSCTFSEKDMKLQISTLLEGLGPIPLPQARAASPIRTTSGILLSNMYPSHSGNLSSPWSGKYFWLNKDANRIRSHVSPIPGAAALTTWPSNTWQYGNLFIKQ